MRRASVSPSDDTSSVGRTRIPRVSLPHVRVPSLAPSRRGGDVRRLGLTAHASPCVRGRCGGGRGVGLLRGRSSGAHDLATVPVSLTDDIYDRTGEHLLYTLEDERRELIHLGKVPRKMQAATTDIEDKTFWTNPGIDISGIIRAASVNMNGGLQQGGSTITQQLIKTRLLGDEPTITRKIKEAILALEATSTFSKSQILEMYLNQIFYGNQSYGIRAAAKTYFGVLDLSKLTLGQMALLAGLPQAPSAYDPIQNPAAAKARRADVLAAMSTTVTSPGASRRRQRRGDHVKPDDIALRAPSRSGREQIIRELGEKAAYAGATRSSRLDWNMQQLAEKGEGARRRAECVHREHAALITMDRRPRGARVRRLV